jgi:hypothetical protein
MADNPAGKQFLREYEGEHAQELAEWVSIANDLQHVIEACKLLIEMMDSGNEDATLQRALWSSALVAYVRCFKTGRRMSLNPSIYSGLEGDLLALHQTNVDTRDKHIAHPVNVFEETKIGLLIGDAGNVRGHGNLSMFKIAGDRGDVYNLGVLANRAQKYVSGQIEEAQAKVMEGATKISPAELLRLPELQLQPRGGAGAAKQVRPYGKT